MSRGYAIEIGRAITATLIACVIWAQSALILAAQQSNAQQEIVKAAVEKIGNGRRIGVKLISGEVIRGRITAIGPGSFSVEPVHSKTARSIAYSQVSQLKKGSNTFLWAVLGVSVVAIIVIVVAIVRTPTVHPYTAPAV